MVTRGAIKIDTPMFTNSAHPIVVELFSDAAKKTPANLSGYTVRVVVSNPGGGTVSYACTDITASGTPATTYQSRATLTGSNHTTVGTIKLQATFDGLTKEHFTSYLWAKL